MKLLPLILKISAPAFILVGLLHLVFGLYSEVMLGADLDSTVIHNATLDSQNRFYGVCFALYGALMYLGSTDLSKYATMLRLVFWFFFAGGVARIVSILFVGIPVLPILVLTAIELFFPLVLIRLLNQAESKKE